LQFPESKNKVTRRRLGGDCETEHQCDRRKTGTVGKSLRGGRRWGRVETVVVGGFAHDVSRLVIDIRKPGLFRSTGFMGSVAERVLFRDAAGTDENRLEIALIVPWPGCGVDFDGVCGRVADKSRHGGGFQEEGRLGRGEGQMGVATFSSTESRMSPGLVVAVDPPLTTSRCAQTLWMLSTMSSGMP